MPLEAPREETAGVSYANEKRRVYGMLQDLVRDLTGKGISLDDARRAFDLVTEEMVISAARHGAFRLNSGLGTLKVKRIRAGRRRLPTGESCRYPARKKLRFENGLLTEALLAEPRATRKCFEERGVVSQRDQLRLAQKARLVRKRG